MKRKIACLLAVLLLSGCGGKPIVPREREFYAMDTQMRLTAFGGEAEEAVRETEEAICSLEARLSRTDGKSPIARLNAQPEEAVELDEESLALLEAARYWSEETEGAFDPSIAPLADAWGFTGEHQQLPEREALETALSHVGMEHVHVDASAGTVRLDRGSGLDLGGIAKGYASDVAANIYASHGAFGGLAYLGGNVLAWGEKEDGSPWRVGVQDPSPQGENQSFVGVLQLKNAFAITSGGYQRYFEENGQRYHHILDPQTGYPARSGLLSVTVVAEGIPGKGTMCDALSTALFVMGEERALDFWRERREDFQLILVTENGRVLVTEGLAEAFAPQEGSGYIYETVA